MTLLAFHNDPEIKQKYLDRVQAHASADEIIKGRYWEKGKGCAVGCIIHGCNHSAYETELGIPEKLAHLEDRIFEGLPLDLAKTWPNRFLQAIKPGADLSKVWPKFAIFLLTDKSQCASRHPSCDIVATAMLTELNGDIVIWKEIRNAASAYAASASASAYAADAAGKAYIAQSEKLLELLSEA